MLFSGGDGSDDAPADELPRELFLDRARARSTAAATIRGDAAAMPRPAARVRSSGRADAVVCGPVAATPRPPAGYSAERSRRHRGCHVDSSWATTVVPFWFCEKARDRRPARLERRAFSAVHLPPRLQGAPARRAAERQGALLVRPRKSATACTGRVSSARMPFVLSFSKGTPPLRRTNRAVSHEFIFFGGCRENLRSISRRCVACGDSPHQTYETRARRHSSRDRPKTKICHHLKTRPSHGPRAPRDRGRRRRRHVRRGATGSST